MYGNSGSGSGSASAGQQSQQSRHNALPTGAPAPTALDTILHNLSDMHVHANRIEMAINRAAGFSVEDKTGIAPCPEALLDRIAIAMNELRNRLEVAADRLERVA